VRGGVVARTRSNIIVDSVKGTALGSAGAPALVSSRKSLRAAMALRGTPCEDRRTSSADKAGQPWGLGETGPLSERVQARRKALRVRCINGMEVRKMRPRGFKKRLRGFKRAP
jgi:hypothetical protein